MATPAHCLYCFESLSASLEHRSPLRLSQVEELWSQYLADIKATDPDESSAVSAEQPVEDAAGDHEGDSLPGETLGVRGASRRDRVAQLANSSSDSASSTPSSPSIGSKASSSINTPPLSMSSSSSSLASGVQKKPPQAQFPMFVTWNTYSRGRSKNLRGCIGTFEAQELEHGLRTYALTSAFEDVRFSPIKARELPNLECDVTLLTDFETAPDPMAWELGKHGIRISFTYHKQRYGSTYLPDVAREQGWTKTETLVNLMRKAGWNGRSDDWQKVPDLKVVRYQGSKHSMSYTDWQQWQEWVMERQSRN